MALKNLMRCGPVPVLALLALSLALPSAATADPVLIVQFSGLDMIYDSGLLCDAATCNGGSGDPADADPLTSMTFGLDTDGNGAIDVLFGTETADLSADVRLDVGPLPTDGATVSGSAVFSEIFDLLTNPTIPGEGLLLDLQSWNVTLNGPALFFFGGGSATVNSQDLPIPGIGFDDTLLVQWSFSSQVTNLTEADGLATFFNASGTGEVRGPYVPEPGTLLFLGGALSGLALLRRRRQ